MPSFTSVIYFSIRIPILSAIRQNQNIKAFIGPNNTEVKTKGYADDTVVYIRDLDSMEATISLMEKYGQATESNVA